MESNIPNDIQIFINEFSHERYPENGSKRLAHIQGMEAVYAKFCNTNNQSPENNLLNGWTAIEGGLPEVDRPVWVITEYESNASGKPVRHTDTFIGWLDEFGELACHPNGEDYGWSFINCVTHWKHYTQPAPPHTETVNK